MSDSSATRAKLWLGAIAVTLTIAGGVTIVTVINDRPTPSPFVDARTLTPSLGVELRYASTNNFTGQEVDGYLADDVVLLRKDAAAALGRVQSSLAADGLGLFVYDAYRPIDAVRFFQQWSKTDDESTKHEYYPDYDKPQLFELGYIADRSKHSLGGTVDLTVIELKTREPLDMGGTFDFFGERSHYDAPDLSAEQEQNRTLLRNAMIAQGFEPYELEWWHFTYPLPEGTEAVNVPVR